MKLSNPKEKYDCQHDEYCGLAKTVCVETDFPDRCHMKESKIDEMPLLKAVKAKQTSSSGISESSPESTL